MERLFPDYIGEDQKLYRDTGIYTPVHMIVMSRKLDREQSRSCGQNFTPPSNRRSKSPMTIFSAIGGLFSVVYLRERMKEQIAAWGDPWKYGIKANKTTIDAFIKYNVEQGMIRSAIFYGDLFAAGTLDT